MRDINLHIAQANLYGADVVGVSDYVERDARAHHDPATELGEALVPRMLGRPRCYFRRNRRRPCGCCPCPREAPGAAQSRGSVSGRGQRRPGACGPPRGRRAARGEGHGVMVAALGDPVASDRLHGTGRERPRSASREVRSSAGAPQPQTRRGRGFCRSRFRPIGDPIRCRR